MFNSSYRTDLFTLAFYIYSYQILCYESIFDANAQFDACFFKYVFYSIPCNDGHIFNELYTLR